MPHVSFEIPDDLLRTLREQPAELSQEMRLVTAIHYLREKRLSLGQAARFAGANRLDFLDVLTSPERFRLSTCRKKTRWQKSPPRNELYCE